MPIRELSEIDESADQPPNFRVQLKPHQLTILRACREFEVGNLDITGILSNIECNEIGLHSRIGIIGDKVGAGKSYVVLALAMSDMRSSAFSSRELKAYAGHNVIVCKKHNLHAVSTSLLVVPNNLVVQWDVYISNFMPLGCRYVIINRGRLLDLVEDVDYYDLIVVTNTLYNSFVGQHPNILWKRAFFDEVDNIKLHNALSINACAYWCVTASYNNLLHPQGRHVTDPNTGYVIRSATGLKNMSGFVKNMFLELGRELEHDIFARLIVKNADAFVDASIDIPSIEEVTLLCKQPRSINVLNGLVDTIIIQHLNANDVNGAMTFINPQQVDSEANIIKCLVNSLERKLTNVELKISFVRASFFDSERQRETELLRLESARTELTRQVLLISERVTSCDACAICYNDFDTTDNSKSIVPCCSNAFCFKCISRWITSHHVCPLCKASINMNDLMLVDAQDDCGGVSQELKDRPLSSKIEALEVMLRSVTSQPHRKVIIFSAFDNSFSVITPLLDRKNIGYDFLKGPWMHVTNIVKKFKDDSCLSMGKRPQPLVHNNLKVLLVNSTYFGSGLNLENTTDIVMFHRFDSEIERQVIGRAQRPGRTERLKIWYILYENE
jgi:SNF2 family DNA or RNA helicase